MKLDAEILEVLCGEREGSLGTVENGKPYVSAVGFVYTPAEEEAGEIHLLLSGLARHTKNLAVSPWASLLVVETRGGVPVHERRRLSIQGRAVRVDDKPRHETLKTEYLKLFPRAEMFFQLPDFRFYRLGIEEVHWIGGFGRARTIS